MGAAVSREGTDDSSWIARAGRSAPLPFGHLFPHPTLEGKLWSMLCYTNGDIMRKKAG